MQTKNLKLLLIPGTGSIVLGFPYILSLFGPTESEVRFWGLVSSSVGMVTVALVTTMRDKPNPAAKMILNLSHLGIALLQILPIMLWWEFHGRGISDGTPPSAFVAHWGFSVPHIALLAISIIAAYMTLFRRERQR